MSDPLRVPAVKTPVTMPAYARAVVAAWPLVEQAPVTREAVAVLWGQYALETGGGASCYGHNLGNAKAGEGQRYHCLVGTWECVSPASAAALVARGEAVVPTAHKHAAACPAGKVLVVFQPPHKATRFRAFGSLEEGMRHHLALVARRFRAAWPMVLAGDPEGFAHALKAGPDGKPGTWDDYFTADAGAYARGVRRGFAAFLAAGAYAQAAPTLPALPDVPSSPEPVTEPDGGASRWAATRLAATGREPGDPDAG